MFILGRIPLRRAQPRRRAEGAFPLAAQLIVDGEPQARIVPGKVHAIVVENDRGRLNMFVDGQNVLSANENSSTLGEGHDRVGFYFYTPCKVFNVKVYVKRLSSGLDIEPAGVH